MKKLIKIILYLLAICLMFMYKDEIISKITYMFDYNKKIVLATPNSYYKNMNYNFVKQSEDFIPYSKQDLINIYYSALDRGYETFTFYCPSEYKNCLIDLEDLISEQNKALSNINYFVSPFNTERKITTSYSTTGEITLNIEKLYTKEQIEAVNNKIDEIIKNYLKDDMSIEDKLLIIHDYIVNNTIYDEAAINGVSNYISYNSYGTLIQGYSTCNGYADTMALFLDRLGVKNFRVASSTHVWNVVYLNNEWFHIDVTWDDPITKKPNSNELTHKFYLITTDTLESYNIEEHDFSKIIFGEVA